jgi:hypothetical protein
MIGDLTCVSCPAMPGRSQPKQARAAAKPACAALKHFGPATRRAERAHQIAAYRTAMAKLGSAQWLSRTQQATLTRLVASA